MAVAVTVTLTVGCIAVCVFFVSVPIYIYCVVAQAPSTQLVARPSFVYQYIGHFF